MNMAAKALGTTVWKLTRIIETFKAKGMEGVKERNLPHVISRNPKNLGLTSHQLMVICSKPQLQEVATMSLVERAAFYNEHWKEQGCNINAKDLSEFYKGAGITLQRFVHALGPP